MAASTLWRPFARWSTSGIRAMNGMLQIVGGLAIWGLYLVITHNIDSDPAQTDGRGRQLLRWERHWHLDVEHSADRWLSHHQVLGWLAAWEYATTYILTTFLVLGWLWWRRPASYVWARNTLVWVTLIALLCFYFYPTTPPRLLPGAGFYDVVAAHHPVLSWGGGKVANSADQYAAMPSLHVGWAVWVTAVCLRARSTRPGYGLAIAHLVLTAAVVIGTGNHYVLDVLTGAALMPAAAGIERIRQLFWGRSAEPSAGGSVKVAASDEFFLHVETPGVQQPVGGFVMLDRAGATGPLDLPAVRAVLAERITGMPRFQQRLVQSRWRHGRWVPADPDLDHHVREHVLPGAGGRAALADFISSLTEQQLDRSRPMWQLWLVPNSDQGMVTVIAIMHHAFADGLGVVDILRQLFEPPLPAPDLSAFREPSRLVRLGATVTGIAQLATDGNATPFPFTQSLSGHRRYRFASTPLGPVRESARLADARVTDVLLAAIGDAVSSVLIDRGEPVAGRSLRAAVPITTRLPAPAGTGRDAEPGNRTAALRLDVPLGPMPVSERLRRTSAGATRHRRSGRAIAATSVIELLGLLPPPLHRRAARAVYGGRHFTAIVSNMPGPSVQMSLAGAPIRDTYPVLPLAEGVPLAVGTLGWADELCLSVLTDTERLPEADELTERIIDALLRLQQETGVSAPIAQLL